jgi:D-alanyl-D-alanine carboxypeptidase
MKYIVFLALIISLSACQKDVWQTKNSVCEVKEKFNTEHSKSKDLQQVMDKYVQKGLPGISIAMYSPEGYWLGAAGYAQIETQTLMQPCHLQYSQSVAKTYMAVAILKLYEEGKIDLDEKISKYLPQDIYSKITDADKISVRMLLNHTSGIPEYNSNPQYVSFLLQHPTYQFQPKDLFLFTANKPLQFEPTTKVRYTNTNYLLLAMIGDQLTGNHAKYIKEQILQPLGIVNTFYREDENYLNNPNLVNSYWDRYSNRVLENCSKIHQINVASMIGDDGIIATPLDYVNFLKALFEGKIISEASLNQMLVMQRKKPDATYGYGLGISEDVYKGFKHYGHSGGGIGAGCYLRYFPEKQTYFFVAINIGTSISSPILDDLAPIVDEILDIMIK